MSWGCKLCAVHPFPRIRITIRITEGTDMQKLWRKKLPIATLKRSRASWWAECTSISHLFTAGCLTTVLRTLQDLTSWYRFSLLYCTICTLCTWSPLYHTLHCMPKLVMPCFTTTLYNLPDLTSSSDKRWLSFKYGPWAQRFICILYQDSCYRRDFWRQNCPS